MLRPYNGWLADDDDAMDVVRHDDMGVQCGIGEMIGYSLPATIGDLTEFRKRHPAIGDPAQPA